MARIENPSLVFGPDDVVRSATFDDVYYSVENGLAETTAVFLGGNNLPARWQHGGQFTIGETGFGTGLNFLAAWKMFEDTAPPDARLDVVSCERFPIAPDDLARALAPWAAHVGADRVARLLAVYPPRIPGFHRRWITPRVTLTLIFDDAVRAYSQLDGVIDAWFLDGFSPAKNDAMWNDALYAHIARSSRQGTTCASFTAAGHVRRGLDKAGFTVSRVDGFGHKRHRITGVFNGKPKENKAPPKTVHIVGAGLGGAALAHCFARRGIAPVIFEKNSVPASGASGNALGLVNPKIEAADNPRTDMGQSAFSFATHILSDTHHCDARQTGALHIGFNADKNDRLQKIYARSGWLHPHMRWISASHTENICGLTVPYDGLFYADAMTVKTSAFVTELLHRHETRYGALYDLMHHDIPVIYACGDALRGMFPALPLQPVRGQITYIRAPRTLTCPVMFGHYVAPTTDGLWSLGASFQQNHDSTTPNHDDDTDNMRAVEHMLGLTFRTSPVSSWAGVRTASRDRYPVIGHMRDNVYVSGAFGSHGIQFALLAAEILASRMTGAVLPVGLDALGVLDVGRFGRRN